MKFLWYVTTHAKNWYWKEENGDLKRMQVLYFKSKQKKTHFGFACWEVNVYIILAWFVLLYSVVYVLFVFEKFCADLGQKIREVSTRVKLDRMLMTFKIRRGQPII